MCDLFGCPGLFSRNDARPHVRVSNVRARTYTGVHKNGGPTNVDVRDVETPRSESQAGSWGRLRGQPRVTNPNPGSSPERIQETKL